MRCSSSGRTCDGYADPFRSRTSAVLPSNNIFDSLQNTSSPELISSLTNNLRISDGATIGLLSDKKDRRYLHHFIHNSIQDFSSLVDRDLWSNYILRVSAFTPTVKHAILALSAQHEAFLKHGHNGATGTLLRNDPINAYSRDQYSQAVRCLYYRLDKSPSDTSTTEEALITCLLFILYETLQGNYNAALVHLEGGLSIFSSIGTRKPGLPISETFGQATPISLLAKLFARLDIHASSYAGVRNIGPFSAPSDDLDPEKLFLSVPCQAGETFQSIGDARDSLNTRIACIMKFLRSPAPSLMSIPGLESEKVMELRYNPRLHAPNSDRTVFAHIFREKELHLESLNRWMVQFQEFLQCSSTLISQNEVAINSTRRFMEAQECAAIWLSYLVTFITLSNCFEPDESSYDEYLPQFQKIVEHADSYILSKSGDSRCWPSQRRFALEMVVIYPLYITALKCRDHAVRRHAISLLRISGQEGVWDGKKMAAITEHVANHEEEQGYVEILTRRPADLKLDSETGEFVKNRVKSGGIDSFIIPESARIHGVVVDLFDPGSGKIWIDCSKRKFTYQHGQDNQSKAEWFRLCEWEFHKKLLEW